MSERVTERPSRNRQSLEPRHIRLVESPPEPERESPVSAHAPPAADTASPRSTPKKLRKALEKRAHTLAKAAMKAREKAAKKAKKAARKGSGVPEPRGAETGRHAAVPDPLVAELTGLRDSLASVAARITSLEAAQDPAAAGQVEALTALVSSQQVRNQDLAARIDALSNGLASRNAHEAEGREAALADLWTRLSEVESRLAETTRSLDRAGPQARGSELEDAVARLQDRLGALGSALEVQAQRIVRVERGQGDAGAAPPWGADIRALGADLEGRIAGLSDALAQSQEQARKRVEAEQCWTDSRLRRFGRAQAWALLALGLLTVALLAANWWRVEGQADRTAARLAALEERAAMSAEAGVPEPPGQSPGVVGVAPQRQSLAESELNRALTALTTLTAQLAAAEPRPAPAPAASPPLTEDFLSRLRALEARLTEASTGLAASRELNASIDRRLGELSSAQGDLAARLDRLEQASADADKGLAVLEARVDGVSTAPVPAATPRALPLAPVDAPPAEALSGSGYGVQLVAYNQWDRLASFLARFGLSGGQAKAVPTRIGGGSGYAVVLGPYLSEAEALEAIARLPGRLRDLRPWVRPLPAGTRLLPID